MARKSGNTPTDGALNKVTDKSVRLVGASIGKKLQVKLEESGELPAEIARLLKRLED